MIALSVDVALCIACVSAAYYLRIGEWVWPIRTQWVSYLAAILFAIPLFVSFGLYRAILRYAGWGALMAVVRACGVYGVVYSAVFSGIGVAGVPRTIGFIQPILLFLAIGGSRAFARFWLGGGYAQLRRIGERPKVMIYGAGSAGQKLAAALANNQEMRVVGFIDDDKTLNGNFINGLKIHQSDELGRLLLKLEISDILLAIPSASRKRRNEIIDQVRGTSVGIRTVPDLMDLAQGRVTVNELRELDIEDLLGRDPVIPDPVLMSKNITGKTVLVTGAGGSIGSELCRQIFDLDPATLLLIDTSEFALYAINQELVHKIENNLNVSTKIRPLLASICDEQHIRKILSTWKPNTIYHAAAYKHVPMVEHNSVQGLHNNVFGTLNLVNAALEMGTQDFVLISTDKAVRPTNIMGASKRLAEMILQALAEKDVATRFSMVRFGNVLGSSGSVVPLFRKQIKDGGPITITHRDITRYFMTISEATQLVIQAGSMATGGEVFVLDMGDPVRIVDLARNMIELTGLSVRDVSNPEGDIEITFVGLRPGEKLFEELLIGNNPVSTNHSRIMKATDNFIPWPELKQELDQLVIAMGRNDVYSVRSKLMELVVEFTPDAEVVDWVHMEHDAS